VKAPLSPVDALAAARVTIAEQQLMLDELAPAAETLERLGPVLAGNLKDGTDADPLWALRRSFDHLQACADRAVEEEARLKKEIARLEGELCAAKAQIDGLGAELTAARGEGERLAQVLHNRDPNAPYRPSLSLAKAPTVTHETRPRRAG